MKLNKTIRKVIVLGAWLLVAGGIATLLIAANRKDQAHNCKRVVVSIGGEGENIYIDKNDILGQIKWATKGGVVGKPIAEVNLAMLEQMLEGQTWIRDAELYFDSRDVLHVLIAERDPIARVFNTAGNSFYIDSAAQRMPLLDKVSARLPVVTNFTAAKKLNKKDSVLLRSVTNLAQYIITDKFWNAQIAQIDITPAGTFELVPVIGNHIIRIGTGDEIEEKLDRLFIFYKQVMSKAGFDKYTIVDVQFKDQVLGIKDKYASAVDSIQLQKNIKALIEQTKLQATTDSLAAEKKAAVVTTPVEAAPSKPIDQPKPSITNPNPAPKKVATSNVVEKPGNTKAKKNQPKAVMPKRSN
jgi:cell division protein FtsQ